MMTKSLGERLAEEARFRAEDEAILNESLSHPSYRNWRLFKVGIGCLAIAFVLWKFNLGASASNEAWKWALATGSLLVFAGLFPMLIVLGLWLAAFGAVASPALVSDGGLASVSWGYWAGAGALFLLGIAVARSSTLE